MTFSLLQRLVVTPAFAALPSVNPCVDVPGGCDPAIDIARIFRVPGMLLVSVAAGAAVLFVVLGGVQMLIARGDEGMVTRGRMSAIYALLGFAVALIAQAVVSFIVSGAAPLATYAGTSENFPFFVMQLAIDIMLSVFNITFIIIVMYAGYRMLIAHGKTDEFQKATHMLTWAIVGALLINGAHAIVNSVRFFGF